MTITVRAGHSLRPRLLLLSPLLVQLVAHPLDVRPLLRRRLVLLVRFVRVPVVGTVGMEQEQLVFADDLDGLPAAGDAGTPQGREVGEEVQQGRRATLPPE